MGFEVFVEYIFKPLFAICLWLGLFMYIGASIYQIYANGYVGIIMLGVFLCNPFSIGYILEKIEERR
tara:strand:- start:176 stop:376 length:201 start_codon:yes stop_codon:yes gene_type:complete